MSHTDRRTWHRWPFWMAICIYSYDTNYYAAVVGDKVFLVNKMTVKEMFNAYETMVNGETETEATATPTAEAEK